MKKTNNYNKIKPILSISKNRVKKEFVLNLLLKLKKKNKINEINKISTKYLI